MLSVGPLPNKLISPLKRFFYYGTNKNLINKLDPRFNVQFFKDPLFIIPALDNKTSVSQMIIDMKKDSALEAGPNAMAKVCFHSARYDLYDPYIADFIQETIDIFKERVQPREAFGLLYGALKLSYRKHMILFSRHEFERHEKENIYS